MATIFDLQRATIAARARTGDSTLGTRAHSGLVQVVRVTYPAKLRGAADVICVTALLTPEAAVRALEGLGG